MWEHIHRGISYKIRVVITLLYLGVTPHSFSYNTTFQIKVDEKKMLKNTKKSRTNSYQVGRIRYMMQKWGNFGKKREESWLQSINTFKLTMWEKERKWCQEKKRIAWSYEKRNLDWVLKDNLQEQLGYGRWFLREKGQETINADTQRKVTQDHCIISGRMHWIPLQDWEGSKKNRSDLYAPTMIDYPSITIIKWPNFTVLLKLRDQALIHQNVTKVRSSIILNSATMPKVRSLWHERNHLLRYI